MNELIKQAANKRPYLREEAIAAYCWGRVDDDRLAMAGHHQGENAAGPPRVEAEVEDEQQLHLGDEQKAADQSLVRSVSSSLRAAAASFRESLSFRDHGEQEQEEVELKWAAIERLPTFDRLHTSLLHARLGLRRDIHGSGNDNGLEVVDVRRLGAAERRLVVESLIANIHHDNLRLLQKQRQRMDRVGVRPPTVEVRWRDVCVEAGCEVVHGKPLPTLLNSAMSKLSVSMLSLRAGQTAVLVGLARQCWPDPDRHGTILFTDRVDMTR